MLKQVQSHMETVRGRSQDSPSDMIYHYTNAMALESILRTKSLWASSAFYLNDTREYFEGEDLLKHVLPPSATSPRWRKAFLESLLKEARQLDTFVCCFCQHGDLLSQWRHYAGGDGYAIGFSKGIFKKKLAEAKPRIGSLHDVTYATCTQDNVDWADDPALKSFLKRCVIDILLPPRQKSSAPTPEEARSIVELLVTLKNRGFEEEAETRLIVNETKNGRKHRISNGRLIPYVVIDLPEEAIAEIAIGPGHPDRSDLAEKGLQSLLRSNRLNDVVVRRARTPYRSW